MNLTNTKSLYLHQGHNKASSGFELAAFLLPSKNLSQSCSTSTSFHLVCLWSVKKCQCDIFMWHWLHGSHYICLCFTTVFIFLHTSALLFASFPTRLQVFQGLLLFISPQSRPWFLRCPSCSSPCSLYVTTRKIWDLVHTPNRSGHVFM